MLESDSCIAEPTRIADMQFLFQKIDSRIFNNIPSKNDSLASVCLQMCLTEADTLDNQLALLISATLKRILTLYRDFSQSLSLETSMKIVDYVFKKWDSAVDVICYESVDSFSLLLDIHNAHCPDCSKRGACQFREDVTTELLRSPATCRSIFKCITHLSATYPWLDLINSDFVRKLYDHIGAPSVVVVICEIICNDLAISKTTRSVHLDCIEQCLNSENKPLRSSIMDRLLPNLVKKGLSNLISELLLNLTAEGFSTSPTHLETVLTLVGMLIKANGSRIWSDLISKELLVTAILHCSSQVRLTAWNLLCIHPRISTPYSLDDLTLMRIYLTTSATEQSPAIRQKMLAAFKQVLLRIAETSETILKRKTNNNNPENLKLVESYGNFLVETLNQAFDALQPAANFNRRVFALYLIDYVYRQDYLHPPGRESFWKQTRISSLIDHEKYLGLVRCLDDDFQYCQIMALDLLKTLNSPAVDLFWKKTDEFYQESIRIMKTIRSHNSLSASYRLQFYAHRNPEELTTILTNFVEDCQNYLSTLEKNMMLITENPLHPILSVLVSLLPKRESFEGKNEHFWRDFVPNRLIPLCYRISDLVTPVVHSMAPEGYIPEEELNVLAGPKNSTRLQADISQLLLVCCWRAHKHVSEIFDWAVRTAYPSCIQADEIRTIGEYFWLQLTECRHCGAFESAVEGFTYLCSFLWRSKDPKMIKPIDWLRRILKSLEGGEDLDNLCSTRRSAGVPHLVEAILSTEPLASGLEGFALAAESLLNLEGRDVRYRVHCLNVLKALIESSQLRERVASIIEPACRWAIAGCSSESWSERNASAQLAAALKTHIFGVTRSSQRDLYVDSKNRQSAHEFFSRYSSLYACLFYQLKTAENEFTVYPILIFLTHLYMTNTKTPYPLKPFIPLCLKTLLSCRAEKLRRLCAVATISICQDDDIEHILAWLNETTTENLRQNHVNAYLLLLQAILVTRPQEFRKEIEEIVNKFNMEACCEFNQNLFQEVQNQLEGKEHYFSPTAAIAKVQKEILSKRSFEPVTDCTNAIKEEICSWLCQIEKLDFNHGIQNLLRDFSYNVMRVLDKYYDTPLFNCQEFRESLLVSIEQWISKTRTLLPDMLAVYYSLMAKWRPVDDDLVEWAQGTIDIEEDYPKKKAIEICTERYTNHKGYIKVLLQMLQDEDVEIREIAATAVSFKILNKDFQLNPEVCRYALMKKFIPDGEELFPRKTAENDDILFDACAPNVYAEPCLFGDFSSVDRYL